jgi:hypothetical protein
VSRLINTTTMTVDGVTDVGEWYIPEGEHDRAALDQFDDSGGTLLRYEPRPRPTDSGTVLLT